MAYDANWSATQVLHLDFSVSKTALSAFGVVAEIAHRGTCTPNQTLLRCFALHWRTWAWYSKRSSSPHYTGFKSVASTLGYWSMEHLSRLARLHNRFAIGRITIFATGTLGWLRRIKLQLEGPQPSVLSLDDSHNFAVPGAAPGPPESESGVLLVRRQRNTNRPY